MATMATDFFGKPGDGTFLPFEFHQYHSPYIYLVFVHEKSVKLFVDAYFPYQALPKPLSVNKYENSSRLTT